jgi:PadR family transcriptional regulator PadR
MGAMNATKSSEFLPGTLDMLILRTLTVGPLHGYGIAQFIRRKSEDVLQVGEGSLYPALQRLRVQGYIKAEWGESENKRRARYYRLTRKGEKQLEREVVSFNRLMEAIARVMQPT